MKDGKHLILCVDDDADLLGMMKIILEKGGYAVETAANEDEAVKKFTEVAPDIILLDLMMERVDSALNFMNKIKFGKSVPPVFLLSSVGNDFFQSVDIRELGFAGTLQKPVDPDVLLKLIKTRLGA